MKKYSDQLFEDIVPNRRKPEDPKAHAAKRAYRIAQCYPQAVLKVISWAHDANSVMNTLSYISREGDLELEDPQGDKLNADQVKERLDEWAMDFDDWKKNSRESMHMTLSAPEGSPPGAVLEAARKFGRDIFPNHDYLFVRHDDTDHPHVHFVVKSRGYDLTKVHPGRKDLREWREHFAQCMREEGVQVEASPRLMRGLFGRSPPVRGPKAALWRSENDSHAIPDPILLQHQLSDPLKRALKRSEAYQEAFEAMGEELVEKGRELKNKGLLGMGEAIQRYAVTREKAQFQDVQRLYYAQRRIGRAVKEQGGMELGV